MGYANLFDKVDEKHLVKWYQLIVPKLFGKRVISEDVGKEWTYYIESVHYSGKVYIIREWKQATLYMTSTKSKLTSKEE